MVKSRVSSTGTASPKNIAPPTNTDSKMEPSSAGGSTSSGAKNPRTSPEGIQATSMPRNDHAQLAVERSLRRKLDSQLVPLCLMLYLLSFLDRTNIGQARLNGLPEDLGLTSKDFRIALTVLYIPYIIFEIPSNLVVKKFGPARWIPFLVSSWGLVSTLQGVVTTKTGLYVNRAFLGMAEAGILPSIALYLTFFYKPHELGLRQALYFSGASLAGTIGGLLATAIGLIDGKLGSWAYIFIIEGVVTVLFGVLCFWLLPNDISKLWWLTPAERDLAYSRMAPFPLPASTTNDSEKQATASEAALTHAEADEAGAGQKVAVVGNDLEAKTTNSFVLREVGRAFTDPLVLMFAAAGYSYATLLYSNAFFAPTIIKSLNLARTTAESQLLSVPPTTVAFFVSVISAILSDKYRWRWPAVVILLLVSIAGTGLAFASTVPAQRYGGIILLSCGTYSVPPIGISWMLNNTAGHYKKATAIALYIICTNSGGITSTWLFNDSEAPQYSRGFLVNLCLNAGAVGIVTLAELYMVWETKQRKAGKRDYRVQRLREQHGWSDYRIRDYLGDQHPDYRYML